MSKAWRDAVATIHNFPMKIRRAVISSCLRKISYKNANKAENGKVKTEKRIGKQLRYYKCEWCEGFHLTSQMRDIDYL